MSEWVLDASAVLAVLKHEPGEERVTEALVAGAVISTVNLSEVVAKLAGAGAPEAGIRARIAGLRVDVAPFDADAAFAAGLLIPLTRSCRPLARRPRLHRPGAAPRPPRPHRRRRLGGPRPRRRDHGPPLVRPGPLKWWERSSDAQPRDQPRRDPGPAAGAQPTLADRFGVVDLALFGSTARGDASPESDIDILVRFDGPTQPKCYFGALFYLEGLLGRPRRSGHRQGAPPRVPPLC